MDGEVDGKPVPQALNDRGVVPFIKIDKGLEDEANGVQLMKPMPELDALLEPRQGARRVRHQGALGDQLGQSRRASPPSSRSSSRSAQQVLGARPGPDHRARSEHQEPRARRSRPHPARRNCSKQLDALPDGQQVMLKLSHPGRAGPVRSRWSTIPGCCASSRCRAASAAPRPAASWPGIPGMIASFSRALLVGPAPPDERRGIRPRAGHGDRRNLPRLDREGRGLTLAALEIEGEAVGAGVGPGSRQP